LPPEQTATTRVLHVLRDLERELSDAAGGAEDQRALARREPAELDHRQPGRDPGHRERGRDVEIQLRG
jgi:hypothetical protein